MRDLNVRFPTQRKKYAGTIEKIIRNYTGRGMRFLQEPDGGGLKRTNGAKTFKKRSRQYRGMPVSVQVRVDRSRLSSRRRDARGAERKLLTPYAWALGCAPPYPSSSEGGTP